MKIKLLEIILLNLLLLSSALFADNSFFDHYVVDNLRLRTEDNLSAKIVTTLPRFTATREIESGPETEIDGISAPWVKVVTQTGYSGWCFSGYIKPIEKDISSELAKSFPANNQGEFPGMSQPILDPSSLKNVDLVTEITDHVGLYIQQTPRPLQGPGHHPEILYLLIENGKVEIEEIDVVNREEIVRKKIELRFDGKTFSNGRTKLKFANDKILIYYREGELSSYSSDTWDELLPFTYAGTMRDSVPDRVQRLTTDYLRTFEGNYALDSYKTIVANNFELNANVISKATISVKYVGRLKCLSVALHDLKFIERSSNVSIDRQFNFVETLSDEPFYWIYGEGAGFKETKAFFYKGGIAITYEANFGQDGPEIDPSFKGSNIRCVFFFKKVGL